jgi:hypothetical protein
MIQIEKFLNETQVACHKALKLISANLSKDLDTKSLYNLSNSISALSRSISDLDKASRDRLSLVTQVAEEMKVLFKRTLEGYPELCDQVIEVIDQTAIEAAKDNKRELKLINNKRNK